MQPKSRSSSPAKPSIRLMAVGQLLCQYGDPPGPLYIIVSGKLVVYRPNPKRPNENIELAQLGPGAVVGEVAPILGQLRSASVRALEKSTLIAVPADQLGTLASVQVPLAQVIVHALHERTSLSANDISTLVDKLGIQLPDIAAFLQREDEQAHPAAIPGGASASIRADALYAKTVTCPMCDTPFLAQVVRLNKYRPLRQESDFHQIYEAGFNPYDYEPWVCPTDLFAALPADFGIVSDDQRKRLAAAIAELVDTAWAGERPLFIGDRTLALRERALQIALAVCGIRRAGPVRRAAVQHRLAWCAREREDTVSEQFWLSQALESYSAAQEQEAFASARQELRIGYLCGELSLRLGDHVSARKSFGEMLSYPALDAHPVWKRLLRAQLEIARTACQPDTKVW